MGWHGLTNAQLVKLESVDHALLRGILKAHSKSPTEFLHLETGTMPLRWIILQRRINYLRHIVQRHDSELIKKVFLAQKEQPTRGDFVKLVEKDLSDIGISYEEALQSDMTKEKLKKLARNAAFRQLLNQQSEHKKVKQIKYMTLTLQPYLDSEIFKEKQTTLLTALRSNCVRGIKMNFSKMYKNDLSCPLKCDDKNPNLDSQEHLLFCKALSDGGSTVHISQIYKSIQDQQNISNILFDLIKKRENLMELKNSLQLLPTKGNILGPSSRQHQQLGAAVLIV